MKITKMKLLNMMFIALVLLAYLSAQSQVSPEKKKWLSAGMFQNWYSSTGNEIEQGRIAEQQDGSQWPAIYRNTDMQAAKGLWIGCVNFTDENGNTFPFKVVHCGPRVRGLGEGGQGGFFPVRYKLISKFQQPSIVVDDNPSAYRNDEIDSIDQNMLPDRMIDNIVNTSIGVTMHRRIMQFSQGFHDSYIINEVTFTNTGNTDYDDQIELPNTTITGFYAFYQLRYAVAKEGTYVMGNSSRWGINTMNDVRGDGVKPDPPTEQFRAQFAWHGKYPSWTRFDNLGAPIWDSPQFDKADTVGRLAAPQFIGIVTIYSDKSATDRTDDVLQPKTTYYIDSDNGLNSGQSSQFNQGEMTGQYTLMSFGHRSPRHADLVQPDGKFTEPTADPSLGTSGGWSFGNGYGPYTLAPGQSIKIVFAEAANGLSREKATSVGRRFKAGTITAKAKNDSVFTGRDSLFQTFRRAIANYQANYVIPQPARPPKSFTVKSGGDKISLLWEPDATDPNLAGFEIYRTKGRYDADTVQLLYRAGRTETSYNDTSAIRGLAYYYHILAVGDPARNPGGGGTPAGVALKSSRVYAQTYDPAFLKRQAGPGLDGTVADNLTQIRIVPNPYVLTSDRDAYRLGLGQENTIKFYNIPGYCTIKIYTELGELIKEIEHNDGSGDASWNCVTSSAQIVVSGVYIVVVLDTRTGGKSMQKFVVIR